MPDRFVRTKQAKPRSKAVRACAIALSGLAILATVLFICLPGAGDQPASDQISRAESTAAATDAASNAGASGSLAAEGEAAGSARADAEAGVGTEAGTGAEAEAGAGAGAAASAGSVASSGAESVARANAEALRADLGIVEDYRAAFSHGPKGAEFQRYIVLHDTENEADPQSIVSYWAGAGNGVAAHFVVGVDGAVVQCVPLDEIAHHAGYGDTGHNDLYGLVEDGRDDMAGSSPIGSWASDYGMNAYSVGIEMVHVGGSGPYPEAQLAAVDKLIAYIDAHYGFESTIIDHKAWRTGNSDTSAEFAAYLANYQSRRVHE